MHNTEHFDEQILGAFVDGQLDAANAERIIAAMDRDPQVREQVYQLRRAKDLMKIGFGEAMPPRRKGSTRRSWWRRYSFAVAASVATAAVGVSAWSLGHYYSPMPADSLRAAYAGGVQQQAQRVVLHISESMPQQFAAALKYVEQFADRTEGQGGQIEVIANAGGLDLLRVGVSPFEQQVRHIMAKHGNVHFIACANAVRNLREQGVSVNIITDIDTSHTAVERIVERLQNGWNYVKVEDLTEL